MCLHKVFILVTQLIGTLISAPEFVRPLLVFDCHAAVLYLVLLTPDRALSMFALHRIVLVHLDAATRQTLTELEALGGTTKHIVDLAIAIQPTDDLILRRHVQLLHDFVQFLAQFDILCIEIGNLRVLLTKQEFEVLHLVRGLAALGLPLQISTVCMLTVLDQLLV